MLDRLRVACHRALTTPLGDSFFPVRVPKDIARRVNSLIGKPVCSAQELTRRRKARERLASLRVEGARGVKTTPKANDPAPVTVYFEKGRNDRLLGRIREALEARSIAYTALEVDEATKDFVMRVSKCDEDELPIVFVSTTPVGKYTDLVEWDASGRLMAAVFGAKAPAKA